ncbi:uncharacterized protein N7503_005464 [Penicillium pulvis]|uniref:uncharacterized protein n=1 Tax=Penicillium pulvis TaxID=1562058 RepID=UPI0025486A2F|nr:uncharacterized protein N7503_005464 [Penicillium pulvis]KAJ5803014.1 hypothetical protein N7503_005464 [Penicillium pulvis]
MKSTTASSMHEYLLILDTGRILQPAQRQSPALTEHTPNRLVEKTTGKSLSSRPAKPSTSKASFDSRKRRNSRNPSVALNSIEDPGFVRFLRAHSSPLHQRVTAGGRIVAMDPVDRLFLVEGRGVPVDRPSSLLGDIIVPVGGTSAAALQNASHDWEIAPQVMVNEPTSNVQPSEPVLDTVDAQVPQPTEHWGSQSTTPVDSPPRPAHANITFPSSLLANDQYAQSNSRQNHTYAHGGIFPTPLSPYMPPGQWFPPDIFAPHMPMDILDPIYASLNLNTNSSAIRRMSPDRLFQSLFPMTAMHTALPPGHFYLAAWMRSDDHRTESWRGFVDSLVEETAGNSNWVDGLYRDLLALSDPIDRIIRELDQIIARTLETRPRDRDMRVLYINMRQIVHESRRRLQTFSNTAPNMAPNTAPNMAPNMAPNLAPGVSPLHLHPYSASTGIPLYQFPYAPQNGSMIYRPQHISGTLSDASMGTAGLQDFTQAPGVQPTGTANFTPSGPDQIESPWPSWFNQNMLPILSQLGHDQRNYGTPGGLHGSNNDWNLERDTEPGIFDTPSTHVDGTHVNSMEVGAQTNGIGVGTQVNGMESLLFGEQAHNHGATGNFRRVWILEDSRTLDAASTQVDSSQVNGTYYDGTLIHGTYDNGIEVSIFDGLIARMTELPSSIRDQNRVEREQGFHDRHHFAPPRPFDNTEEGNQQMMDSYEEPTAPHRSSLPSSLSSEACFELPPSPMPESGFSDKWRQYRDSGYTDDGVDEWPQLEGDASIERLREDWQSLSESKGENSDDVEDTGSEGGKSLSANVYDGESGNELGDEDSTGDDVGSGGTPNNEPNLSGEDQDERSHHRISNRDETIGAESPTNGSQNDNDQMSLVLLPVNIPHHQPIVQLSTANVHGEIAQPGGYQHHEADTNTLVSNTAQEGQDESVSMRVMKGCIKASSCCLSVRKG